MSYGINRVYAKRGKTLQHDAIRMLVWGFGGNYVARWKVSTSSDPMCHEQVETFNLRHATLNILLKLHVCVTFSDQYLN